jgi:hypothetical protein
MKKVLLLGLLIPAINFAQQFLIDWHESPGAAATENGIIPTSSPKPTNASLIIHPASYETHAV